MRESMNTGAVPEALTLQAWFNTIAGKFPPDELHLFTKEMKYLYGIRPMRRKQTKSDRFPRGKSVFDVVDRKFAELILENLEKVLKGGTVSFEAEYKGRRYLSHAVPLHNPNDAETYVLVHATDITDFENLEYVAPSGENPSDRISAGAAAGHTPGLEEIFRLVLENVPDLIAVLDLAGRHVYVNPSYKNIISDPETLLGKEVLDIVHPDDREKVKEVLKEGLMTGQEQRVEFRMVAPNGVVRYVEAGGKAVKGPNGELKNAVIVSRDVTEKRRIEEQYLRNQRIESLGTLAAGISHDLNNVLTPVILGVEALKRIRLDDRGLAILNSISGSLGRGKDIVKQVLTFARGIEGGTMLIQIRHILKEAVALMKETFPKSIAIVDNIPKTLRMINGDATRVDQLVMTLLVNARDAMPDGGILYISAEDVMLDKQYASMQPDAVPGPYVKLSVQDTGAGLPKSVKEQIQDPLFTGVKEGKGGRPGLDVVLSIVKSHGGFTTMESEPGKGSTFSVFLPAVETPENEEPVAADTRLPAGQGELLLVVDDESSVCQITKQTLEAYGYRVLTAADGAEAVALFAENRDSVSLVVMDIAMPVMDGPRTIRALRRLNPNSRIVASSGIVSEDSLKFEDAAAPNAFLSKPYTSEHLLRTIRSVLEAR